ncbi:MAG: nicotinate-nucleotide adenylyltransferase [Ignavibacteria bacterium]
MFNALKQKSQKKIGILGGSFNPIHLGHLILANTVCEEFQLDKIIFVPCYIQPLKSNKDFAPPEARLEMIKLAIQNNPKFEVSDIEIKRKGMSYTVDTLKYFKKKFDDLYFVIGADNIKDFHHWKEPDQILELTKLIVTNRGGIDKKIPEKLRGKKIFVCRIPDIEISSTMIRNNIRSNKSIKYLVPQKVETYIIKNKLYKNYGG